MESIWWVFKQIFDKGLVYQGVKVMPYSTGCTTSLSNFESGQNYKDTIDPAVVVSFPIIGAAAEFSDTSFLAWTTTPWTLPSNLALCVNPEMVYVKVTIDGSKPYILAESRLAATFPKATDIKTLATFKGSDLLGLKYESCFPYFIEYGKKMNAFRVLGDSYVTEDSGTGVVHQAPYFGEDDFRVCLANGVIKRDSEIVCPVDDVGCFTTPVNDFLGQYVKDADKGIIAKLKELGKLVSHSQVHHSYPYCWRSDTPLIYKAVPSWFVRVEHMSQRLLAASAQTYWVPDYVKEKRFGNWLRDARDWAISRKRYWGTPIPLWISEDGLEIVCVGSIAELEALTGKKVNDLHREVVDELVIPSKRPGQPPLRRIPEVFDCWFESGSMPYAQQHYPFKMNPTEFKTLFPADFIAEGIDQTRGWFYTLLVISTALFDIPPYKNLIANGLVLASDGQKMSKRKKNYPDPMEVVYKYGADALRLYLINSPVVRGENLKFQENGVRDIIKDVFLPWFNAYRFLFQNIYRYTKETGKKFDYDEGEFNFDMNSLLETFNMDRQKNDIMDIWIMSFKETLVEFFEREMKLYRLYTVVPQLTKFIDQLTNWYVRLNRNRLKGEFGQKECRKSLRVLFNLLLAMCKMMAPFTPFLAEYMYQRLVLLLRTHIQSGPAKSIHYEMMATANKKFQLPEVEICVQQMQTIIDLGRVVRERNTLPVKYPLKELIVIHPNKAYLDRVKKLRDFILRELNIKELTLSSDKERYGVKIVAQPDFKVLGKKLKGDLKAATIEIKLLTDAQLENAQKNGGIQLNAGNAWIACEELRMTYMINENKAGGQFDTNTDGESLILVDLQPTQEMFDEGIAREIINRIQKLKKKAKLIATDAVRVHYELVIQRAKEGDMMIDLPSVINKYGSLIEQTIKSPFRPLKTAGQNVIEETVQIKQCTMVLVICQDTENIWAKEIERLDKMAKQWSRKPNREWINVVGINGQTLETGCLVWSKNCKLFEEIRRLFKFISLNAENYCFNLNNVELDVVDNRLNDLVTDLLTSGKHLLIVYDRHPNQRPDDGILEKLKNCVTIQTSPFHDFANLKTDKENYTCFLQNPNGKYLYLNNNREKYLKQMQNVLMVSEEWKEV